MDESAGGEFIEEFVKFNLVASLTVKLQFKPWNLRNTGKILIQMADEAEKKEKEGVERANQARWN